MDDNKNLKDELDDLLNDAKEGAKKIEGEARQSAQDFSNSAKETFGPSAENKKILAGVLAILLGALGVHKFILGYIKEGVIILIITIVLSVLTCGVAGWLMTILGLIEGIIYLTKTDEEFYNTYQVGYKPWF